MGHRNNYDWMFWHASPMVFVQAKLCKGKHGVCACVRACLEMTTLK